MYAAPIRSSPKDGRTDSFSSSTLPFSRNLFVLGDFNCPYPLWDPRGTSDPREEEVFGWVISSDLLPLNDPTYSPFYIVPLAVTPPLTSPFLPSLSALSCFWEVLHNLDSDHLPILLPALSLWSFDPTSVPLLSIFRKLAGMTLPPTLTLTVLLQKNTRLFPLLLLSLPL